MRQLGDRGEQLGLDVLAGDEQLDRLQTGRACRLDQILALGDEQAQLLPPALRLQLADELELLVRRRRDQDESGFRYWSLRLATRMPARS